MSNITQTVSVTLTVNEQYFQNWLEANGESYGNLTDDLVEQFKTHLEYHINAVDGIEIPYSASITGVH